MHKRTVSGIILILLLTGLFSLAINVRPVKGEWTGTVYIRADGNIDPPDAPIITYDNVTYILTDNISSSAHGIVVERDNIVIDGAGYTLQGTGIGPYNGVDLNGRSNVTIKNIIIITFYYGIRLDNSSNNNISGNKITNNRDGIWLSSSSNNSICRNNITGNARYGIKLSSSYNNRISGNNITNNLDGIWLSSSYKNRISGNNITANTRYGIGLSTSSNNSICRNNITNNFDGIRLDSSSNNGMTENNITNNYYGIGLHDSSNNNISENNVTANNYYGICLYSSSNNNISENNVTNNFDGIWFFSSSNYNSICRNNITNNGYGIMLSYSSNYNSISENNVTNNVCGIGLSSSSNNSMCRNNITNNYYGIVLDSSSNYNSMCRNNITANTRYGILLRSSSNNTITRNSITNNYYGIRLDNSSNNVIYYNNFVDNSQQVHSYDLTNVWDDGYPNGGNYWSDYTGVDYYIGSNQNITGSDGIGDALYIIDENNVDRYPLIGPFNSFNTSVGYSVDVVSNSTIEDFRYFKSNSTIVMHVSNMTANQTVGFCRLTIPHEVMSPPYTVKVNGTIINFQTIYENFTEGISIIYFTYEHSKLEITIIPEFPSIITLLLMLIVISIIASVKRKVLRRKFPT